MYRIKEAFLSLQGEGQRSGRVAVFCRFSGCNLWSGKETDREKSICSFCDTDFEGVDGVNGGMFEGPETLVEMIVGLWPADRLSARYVVMTGGEPLLQLDRELVEALHKKSFEIAVETNGTLPLPCSIDWVCVSPKAGAKWILREGDELKIAFPQIGLQLDQYLDLPFTHYFLQPIEGSDTQENTRKAIEYCLANPQWRLSTQLHKQVGLP